MKTQGKPEPGAGRKDLARVGTTWGRADLVLRHCNSFGHDYGKAADYYGVSEATVASYVKVAQIFPPSRRAGLTFTDAAQIERWCRQPANVTAEPLLVAAKYQGQGSPKLSLTRFLSKYGRQLSVSRKGDSAIGHEQVHCCVCDRLIGVQVGPSVASTMCQSCVGRVAEFIGRDIASDTA